MLQRDTHRIKKLRTNLGDSAGGAWFNLFNPCKGKFSRYTVSLSFCSYLSLCLSLFFLLFFQKGSPKIKKNPKKCIRKLQIKS